MRQIISSFHAISLVLLGIAVLLGMTVAAAVTLGLVRPVRRLLAGTAAVEGGALDTVIPITSRDEIGRLENGFTKDDRSLLVLLFFKDSGYTTNYPPVLLDQGLIAK
jgi:nitrogen fixation/metabolism regulation signal transduction histidine kinase